MIVRIPLQGGLRGGLPREGHLRNEQIPFGASARQLVIGIAALCVQVKTKRLRISPFRNAKSILMLNLFVHTPNNNHHFSPSRHAEQLRNQSAHLHAAEEHGLQFGDCDRIYKCHQSPLEHVTVLEHSDESAMGS